MLIENNFPEKFQKDSPEIVIKIKLIANIPYPKIFYTVVLLKFRIFEYKSNYDTFIIFGSNCFINLRFYHSLSIWSFLTRFVSFTVKNLI